MRAYRNGEGVVKAPTYEKHMQHNLFTLYLGMLVGFSLLYYQSLSRAGKRAFMEGDTGDISWTRLKPLLERYGTSPAPDGVDGEDRNIDRGYN
jgi:hypothetical protein